MAKKKYSRPEIKKVKLTLNETVLLACKAASGTTTNKNGMNCPGMACSVAVGS